MAPESERAKREANAFLCSPCKNGGHVCFHGSCQCKCNPASWKSVESNEPTLTCSEVVERLAECADIEYTKDKLGGVYTATFNRTKAEAILHSWRERRVQELEKLLAKHSGCSHCNDSASDRTSSRTAKETR